MKNTFALLVVLVSILTASNCHAQFTTSVYKNQVFNPNMRSLFARSNGDINGDSVRDILLGKFGPLFSLTPPSIEGRVEILSGLDGSILYDLSDNSTTSLYGRSVSGLQDINGDGFDEFIVGAPNQSSPGLPLHGRIYVYSGIDGSILFSIDGTVGGGQFGWSVLGMEDLNSDGTPDFAVAEVGNGRILIYSGSDLSVLSTITQPDVTGLGFRQIFSAGDVDSDNTEDIILTDGNRALIYSGMTGNLLWAILPQSSNTQSLSARHVSGVGDVDADGHDDFATVSQSSSVVRIYSGLTGQVIWSTLPLTSSFVYVSRVDGLGDVNGDLVPDVAIANDNANPRLIEIRNGADGTVIDTVTTEVVGAGGGYTSSLGDVDGNGLADFMVIESDVITDKNQMRVFLSGVVPQETYTSNSGNPAGMTLSWEPRRGHPNDVVGNLRCTGATPGGLGLILVSLAPADLPVFGFNLLVAVDSANLATIATLGANAMGEFVVGRLSRRNPFLAGSSTYVQFIETGPTVQASNAIRFTVIS